MKLLTVPNRPRILAKRLRKIARIFRAEENVRFFCLVTLNLDGTTEVFSHGHASLVERLGCLELAKDSLLNPEEE